MASASVSLFINPTAGRGKAGRRLGRIESIFDNEGIEYRLNSSRGVGDLERLARDGGDIVVAGGDGSIHEAVNGIMRAENPARLGVIPTGTGNDFAKACGLSLDWELTATELAARIAKGTTGRSIDVGRMNDRWFANGAGVGFDAKVTRVARSYRWPVAGDLDQIRYAAMARTGHACQYQQRALGRWYVSHCANGEE